MDVKVKGKERAKLLNSHRDSEFKDRADKRLSDLVARYNKCRDFGITTAGIAEKTGLSYMALFRFQEGQLKTPSYVFMATLDEYMTTLNI